MRRASTLPAGTYEYAVTDQFTNSATARHESAAGLSGPVDVRRGTTNEITISTGRRSATPRTTWSTVDTTPRRTLPPPLSAGPGHGCAPATGSAYGTVSTPFSATCPMTLRRSDVDHEVVGGGELEHDVPRHRRRAGTAATEPSTSGGRGRECHGSRTRTSLPRSRRSGSQSVGDDASKPYPRPGGHQFGIGASYVGSGIPRGSTFLLPGTLGARWSRVTRSTSTTTLTRTPRSSTSTRRSIPLARSPAPTTCNFRDVITQVVSGLFSTTMGNDPRPSYVHQTNIIGTPPAGSEESPDLLPPATYTPPATCAAEAPCTTGDGTLYQALDPFLYEYNEYFKSNAPIVQLTEQAIANMLAEQRRGPRPAQSPATSRATSSP